MNIFNPQQKHVYTQTALLSALLVSSLSHADITPDGNTNTIVNLGNNGQEVVSIADPNDDGISYNSYNQFDVSAAGADLDNRAPLARTIVNEVFSNDPSQINGPVEVLGPRAHVIIANPNGITVDGGEFINTGGLALTTGEVDFVDRQVAPGVFQTNTVVTTTDGTIVIGPGGLTGNITQLHLLSEQLDLNGQVVNTTDASNASITVVSGNSTTEFDSSLPAADLNRSWSTIQPTADDGSGNPVQGDAANGVDPIYVDISAEGGLRAGRIQLAVTDTGAGVRHAGDMVATANRFNLSANGELELIGGEITAATDATIVAGNVLVTTDLSNIDMTDNNADNDTSDLAFIEATNGALVVVSDEDIINTGGRMQGSIRNENDGLSTGAVNLYAGGEIINESLDGDNLAIVFGTADNVTLSNTGSSNSSDITNHTGRIISNNNVFVLTDGDFNNVIDEPDFDGRGVVETSESEGSRKWFTLWTIREQISEFSVEYGDLAVPNQLAFVVANGAVVIQADKVNNLGGEIDANGGDVVIEAQGDINNQAIVSGEAEFRQTCSFGCDTDGFSNITFNGGNIQSSGSIRINAEGELVNDGGTLLALDSILVEADGITAIGRETYQVATRPLGIRGFFVNDEAYLQRMNQGGSFVANMGVIDLQTLRPIVLNGTEFIAAEIIIPAGTDIVAEPIQSEAPFGRHIGLFRAWL